MARPVQLAPGSLALVLGPLEEREAVEAAEEPGGRSVFRAFRRANARCPWDARLARAASRLAFVGWLRRAVLLVRAPPACLQVLRDAWRRRALRPPRGFRIRAVGDVFPVRMNPIAPSRFVPLAEVLCCAISDMNTAQIVVTQESLLEHLKKHYPGIALPSQNILYTTLGTLIKERKIYHTGEGYFIVTPQTYFITNTTAQEQKRALRADGSPLGPTTRTRLPGVEGCAELAKETAISVSHCLSCRCFPDMCPQDVEEPPPAAEMTRKGQKGLGESTPLVQNQAVSTSEENHICESPKTLLYTKDREKGKKFGFSLLWRSISRKEKRRTEHSSFSAQFPPEEWPVRDEDNLDNIPRDVEHEIIRRINPILTVDNLMKHTVLMQKYEEQRKYNSQGTSTDVLTVRPKNPYKKGVKKTQSRLAKDCRRGLSHRERSETWSQGSEFQPKSLTLEKARKLPVAQPSPQVKCTLDAATQTGLLENPAALGSQLIYKKQISDPFQGLSLRGSPITKEHNIQKSSHLTPSQTAPKEKPFQRSRFSKSPRAFNREAQQPYTEQGRDQLKAECVYMTNSTVQPVSDDFRDGLLNYPRGSNLQSDSQCYSFRESILRCDVYGAENKVIPEVARKSPSHFGKLGEAKETQPMLPVHSSSSLDPSSACRLVDKTIHQFQNLGLLDHAVGVNHLRQPERQDRNAEELMRKTFVQEAETAHLENKGLSDNEQALCQDEVEEDDGACSSLYLEEDDFSENDDLCHMQPSQYSFADGSNCNHLGKPKVTEGFQTECHSKMEWFVPQLPKRDECSKPTVLPSNPGESQKSNLSAECCGLNSGTQFGLNCEELSVVTCVQASAPADRSSFDHYSARKPNSEAEVPHHSVGDTGKKASGWNQSPQNQKMRKHFTQKLELFNVSCMPVLAQDIQHEHSHLEGTENHSMAGDSGIDSPRTQSLASNNSVILDGLKRRQNFLQNFEGTKSNQTLTSNSLLRLTPVINV